MHAVRYLGELTRCKSWTFETCIKRTARQSVFERARMAQPRELAFMFRFTNPHQIILVRGPEHRRRLTEHPDQKPTEKPERSP